MKRLLHDLRVGEAISINGGALRISLQSKSGQLARLLVEAGEEFQIVFIRRESAESSKEQPHG